ncbi:MULTISPECIES: peptidoglycan DD-metalloendopeptidase family protein [unclassified Streptomyces]|uniref:aggregation-promoting factor C-terminal-like domain-containing protein n=1 Tax=unclassified Streptomyces TaxID=2593676 RepID=UPI00278C8759|nr:MULTISPECIES: peptidoglycan DD-metalloendopeptidase family protein [unclassified Streptomyces]
MPAISIGSVEVDVVPNASGILRRLQSSLVPPATQVGDEMGRIIGQRLAAHIGPAVRDGINDGAKAAKPAATRQGADTGGAFARSLRAKLTEAFWSMPKLNVSLSDTGVDAELARLRARMESLADKTIGIDISAEQARAQAADIEERLRRLGAAHPNVAVRADTAAAIAQLQAVQAQVDELTRDPARIHLETDGQLGTKLRAAVQQAQASLPNINIGADTSPAQVEIARLRERLAGLSDARVGIDISATDALARITEIQARLARLSTQDADIAVRVDAGAASARLLALQAEVSALDGRTANIDVDTHSAVSAMQLLVTAAIAFGPAIIPALPVVAAGLGAIASAGVAAGVGIGSVAAVALPAFRDIGGALTAQKAAQDAATASTSTGGAAASQAAQKALQMAGAQQALATAERNGARQIAQAQAQVRQAKRAAADAVEQAAQRNQQAARAVQDAERSLADAQRDARRAQEELSDARKQAAEELVDLDNRLTDAKLSERDAEIALKEAALQRDAVLKSATSTELDKQKALLQYDQAVQRLKEQRTETGRLKQETAAANRAGVEGSDTVRSAQDRLSQAQRNVAAQARAVKDAQAEAARTQVETSRQVAQAQQRVSEATANVAVAQQNAADAVASAQRQVKQASLSSASGVSQAATAQAKYQAALAKLTPAARQTFNAFVSLRTAFSAWSRSLQPQVMPVFTRALDGIRRALPALTPFVKEAAAAITNLQDRMSRGLKAPWFQSFKTDLQGSVRPAIVGLGVAFGNVFKGMAGVIGAFLPHMDSISARMQGITARFANWGQGLKGSPEFERFLAYSSQMAPKLAQALRQIGGGFLNVGQALSPLSGPLLALLGGIAQAIGIIAQHAPWMVQGIWLIVVAMRAWAIVQRVLNFVMSQNPLVRIAMLIGVLVAAVIYAYNRFGWFRTAVQAVWHAIQASAGAVVNWFTGPFRNFFTVTIPAIFQTVINWVKSNWIYILGFLTGPIGFAVAWIIKHWDLVRAGLLAAWRAIRATVISPIARFFTKTIPGYAAAVRDQVLSRWRALRDGLAVIWGAVRVRVINPIRDFFTRTIPGYASRVRDQVVARWRSLRDRLAVVWAAVKERVINPIRDFFTKKIPGWAGTLKDKVVGAFQRARDGIKSAWSKIEGIAKKPVRFIINTVYNKGIVPVWNKIATAFGAKKLGKMDISGWNTGGVLPGYTPGRDVHLAALSGGEAVMRPEWTRAVGPGYVNSMNAAARGGGVSGVQKALGLPGFADGGIFGWIGKAANTVAGWGSSAWDKVKAGAKWLKDSLGASARAGVKSVVNPLLDKIPGLDNSFGRMIKKIPEKIVNSIFGYADQADAKGASGAGGGIWQKPVNAAYGTPFGKRGSMWSSGRHTGLDFPAAVGTAVRAVADGTVSQVASGGPYGKHVLISHGGGLSSLYAHMSRILTRLHARVNQGQQIGKVGATGNVTGPHLHLEARLNGRSVDPMRYLSGGGGGGNVQAAGSAQRYAKSILGRYGWGSSQFGPLKSLWQHESGWRWNARNPSSGAYGIPQALPASKMASAGRDWRTNAATQIRWGLGYIKGRPDYGSPARAWAKWQSRSPHWYDQGGYLPTGLSTVYNGTGRPEPVLTTGQWNAMTADRSSGGLGDLHVQVFVGDREITDIARAEVHTAQGELVSVLRAG